MTNILLILIFFIVFFVLIFLLFHYSRLKKSSAKNIHQQISLAEQENYSNTGEYYISSSSALSTNCSATATTSSQIEDMLFGNADGVLNDFDQDPPVNGQIGYVPGNGNFYPSFYDSLGRFIFLRLSAQM